MWIYRQSPRQERRPGPDSDGKFEVGYLAGQGITETFVVVEVLETKRGAMELVHYLNGGKE